MITPSQVALGTINKAGATGMAVLDTLIGHDLAERYPKIRIGLIESNVGWIPSYLEQADDRWLHYRFFLHKDHLEMTPSQQWRRNYWATFMCDHIGVELRDYMGVDRIMWSTDYPHGGHEWPNTRNQFDRLFRNVPEDDIQKIVHDNAVTFFSLNI
jgi:predicted TIM-barrel fold metal-dependent hydrolase